MAIIGYGKGCSGLKIELTGILSNTNALKKMADNVKDEVDKQVLMAAVDTANIARKSIQRGPKTGRTYQKYNPRRTHQASAADEAPATDTGALVSSITQEKIGEAEAIVGSKIVYSKFLEFGTRDIDERPFLRPALKKAQKNWEKRMLKELGGKRSRLKDFMTTGVQRG